MMNSQKLKKNSFFEKFNSIKKFRNYKKNVDKIMKIFIEYKNNDRLSKIIEKYEFLSRKSIIEKM